MPLKRSLRKRPSVMIAHRLKTVRNADQIVVIDNKFFLCYYEGGKRKESK